MIKPIMLWITSRSRSSMVSRIFAEHGIFWGNTQRQSAGYDTYENQTIKSLQHKFKPKWWVDHRSPIRAPESVFLEFQRALEKVIPENVIWSMKTGVEYFPAYESLEPYNIFIKRKPEDVAKSLIEKNFSAAFNRTKDSVNKTKALTNAIRGISLTEIHALLDKTNHELNKKYNSLIAEALETITARYEYMDIIQAKHGGIFVDTDKIVNGDFSEIKMAMEYCGIEYNEELTKKAIVK